MSATACPVGPKRWKKTPKMKPGFTTAYDAIKWAHDIVKAENRRLNMGDWIYILQGKTRHGERIHRARLKDFLPRRQAVPECGTVACFAGWIGIGIGMNPNRIIGTKVLEALGFPVTVFGDPVSGAGIKLNGIFYETELKPKAVLRLVKDYLNAYESELKAMKVEVV